jgi:hypothetical protein
METHNMITTTFNVTNKNVIVITDIVDCQSNDVSLWTDENVFTKSSGRPIGSTCQAKTNFNNVLKKAVTDATIFFKKEKDEAKKTINILK